MAIAPAPSSIGKPSAPVSTSKWAYRKSPGVNRPRAFGSSGCSPSPRKVRLTRHRKHSPLRPRWVNGRPHVAQLSAVSPCGFAVLRPALKSSISQHWLRPSIFGTGGAVLHRCLPDPTPSCPLLLSRIHGIADADAKARCAMSRWALRVALRLLPDWVAWRCRQLRMVVIPGATQLCLRFRIRFPNSSTPVKRYSTPIPDHSTRHRSDEQSRASPPRLRVDAPRSIGLADLPRA